MSYRIIPGVRQGVRRNGARYLYQIGIYPNGKSIEVPYTDTGAERGYSIPLPVEIKPQRRQREQKVSYQSRMVLEFRERITQQRHRKVGNSRELQEYIDLQLRPLMRSPDCGKTWVAVELQAVDWMNQYHSEA